MTSPNDYTSSAEYDYTAREARIVPVRSAPRCVRFHRLRRYRWQVTFYERTEPVYPGVFDGRLHLRDESGYTFTALGASLALGRIVRRTPPARGAS